MDIRQRLMQFLNRYQTTGWLVVLLVGGFVFQLLLLLVFQAMDKAEIYDALIHKLVLPPNLKGLIYQPWSLVTYPFFSLGLWQVLHFAVVGLIIWSFGRIHQQLLGEQRTRRLVMLAIPVISLVSVTLSTFLPLTQNLDASPNTELVAESGTEAAPVPETPATTETPPTTTGAQGDTSANQSPAKASASNYQDLAHFYLYPGGMLAMAMVLMISSISLVPSYPVQLLIFGRVQIVWVGVVILFLEFFFAGFVTPLAMTVLIGAGLGFLHIVLLKRGTDLTEMIWSYYADSGKKPKMKVKYGGKPVTTPKSKHASGHSTKGAKGRKEIPQEIIDGILDKISATGYESLSREEKELLFKASTQKEDEKD